MYTSSKFIAYYLKQITMNKLYIQVYILRLLGMYVCSA